MTKAGRPRGPDPTWNEFRRMSRQLRHYYRHRMVRDKHGDDAPKRRDDLLESDPDYAKHYASHVVCKHNAPALQCKHCRNLPQFRRAVEVSK